MCGGYELIAMPPSAATAVWRAASAYFREKPAGDEPAGLVFQCHRRVSCESAMVHLSAVPLMTSDGWPVTPRAAFASV